MVRGCLRVSAANYLINPKGAVIAFHKNAWNSLRSETDPIYSIDAARAGGLKGTLKERNDLSLFCVPPTRLSRPCTKTLTHIVKNIPCAIRDSRIK